jgi:hypothetical protein
LNLFESKNELRQRSKSLLAVVPSLLGLACSAQPGAASDAQGQTPTGATGGSAPAYPTNQPPSSGGAPSASGGAPALPQGSGGAGGVTVVAPPPISGYDARVVFDWPESVGDGGATKCQAGRYSGTFSCNFVPSLADGGALPGQPPAPFLVTGPVELVFTESQNGEFLEVSGGTLTGAALIAITFTAKMSGKLDCQTNHFDGMATDGQYGIQPFPPGGSFSGPTTATYSSTGPALVGGTWQFSVKTPQNTTQGNADCTWTATYVP